MSTIAVFYGSTTGNTESVAKEIGVQLNATVFDVSSSSVEEFNNYDVLLFGTSTWGIGDLQDDWEEFLGDVEKSDLSNKCVGLFGTGDADSYADSFVDGIGKIYKVVVNSGAKVIGKVETSSYEYDDSEAEVDGVFVGLPIDEDNQSDMTADRIENWVSQLKTEISGS